jgi:hypothetical protein
MAEHPAASDTARDVIAVTHITHAQALEPYDGSRTLLAIATGTKHETVDKWFDDGRAIPLVIQRHLMYLHRETYFREQFDALYGANPASPGAFVVLEARAQDLKDNRRRTKERAAQKKLDKEDRERARKPKAD